MPQIMRNDALPYVMGLLATVVGWYLTMVTEDIISRPTLIYDFRYDGAVTTLELLNASRRDSIDAARIQVTCENLRPDCLRPIGTAGLYVGFRAFTPAAPNIPEPALQSPQAIAIDVSLIAGSRVHLTLLRSDPDEPLLMFYEKTSPEEPDILLLRGGTFQAMAVEHYFKLAFVIFVLALVTFITFLAAQFIGLLRPRPKKEARDDDDPDKPQHIVLHLASADALLPTGAGETAGGGAGRPEKQS